jgi:peroxiredoxin
MCHEIGEAFPLYSDPASRVIANLGIAETDEAIDHLIARPTIFIIDAAGVIRYCYVSRDEEDRPKIDLLLLAVDSLSQEDQ